VNRIVLDASALLAILHQEPGSEIFAQRFDLLENASMSAVNITEAYGKLAGLVIDPQDAWEAVIFPVPEIVDFGKEQARIAGWLLPQTRAVGLSLGDRACLALGMALKKHQSTQRIRLGRICG
jgi:ribonuclease VapC